MSVGAVNIQGITGQFPEVYFRLNGSLSLRTQQSFNRAPVLTECYETISDDVLVRKQ